MSARRESLLGFALVASLQLVLLAAGTEAAAALGFALRVPLAPWALAGGVGAAVAAAAIALRRDVPPRVVAAASTLAGAIAVLGPVLAARVYDVSWDGQAYHQLAVLELARGWNPFAGVLPATQGSNLFWVNHYAKGAWVRGAVVMLSGGGLEAAKGWTFSLAAAAGLASFAALLAVPALRGGFAAVAALLAALNPVATAQLVNSYVDGQLASTLTALAAFAALAALRGGILPLAGLAAAALLAPGLKFTGVVYAVAFAGVAAAAAWRWRRTAWRGIALASALGIAAGVGGTGWNPYVTNWRTRGHPFFPIAGPAAVDVLTGQANAEFLARSRVGRLAVSTFAAVLNDREAPPEPKWPFTFVGGETSPFRWPDVRFSGFGPLFSGALVLAVAALLATFASARRAAGIAALCAAAILATALVNPHAWWARYAPQLWLVPLALALAGGIRGARRLPAVLAALALAVLAVDAALVGVNALNRARRISDRLAVQLASLAHEPGPVAVRLGGFESYGVRLAGAGVRFVATDPLPCTRPEVLEGGPVEVCRAGAQRQLESRAPGPQHSP